MQQSQQKSTQIKRHLIASPDKIFFFFNIIASPFPEQYFQF